MKYLLTILSILLIGYSCNPVKNVLKNKQQFEQIGSVWAKDHPCVSDTTIQFLPGDTITNTTLHFDTIFNDLPVVYNIHGDTVYIYNTADKIITKTKVIDHLVKDTIVKYVVDDRALNSAINNLAIDDLKVAADKKLINKLFLILLALGVLSLLLMIIIIKRK